VTPSRLALLRDLAAGRVYAWAYLPYLKAVIPAEWEHADSWLGVADAPWIRKRKVTAAIRPLVAAGLVELKPFTNKTKRFYVVTSSGHSLAETSS
jgi:hypothetical protein